MYRGLPPLRKGLKASLAKHGLKPRDLIPGYRITYQELDNIAYLMRGEGWAGGIGLDEAVKVTLDALNRRPNGNENE